MKRVTALALIMLTVVCTAAHMLAPAREAASLRRREAAMISQAEQLREEIEELRTAINTAGERETIELLARRELGLVYPGEIVFYYAGD